MAVAAAVAALLLTACQGGGSRAADVKAGLVIFANNCARCHGQDGTGGTAPTLNSKEFLTTADDLTIKNTVKVGLAGTRMPAWGKEFGGPMTDKQIDQITAYLRSLEHSAPSVPNWRQGKTGAAAGTTSTTATP